jgi:DnaJ domain.
MNSNEETMGCCNLIIWDFAVVVLVSCYSLPGHIHLLFRILIGIGFGVILFLLYNIPFLGTILQISAGIFWAMVIWVVSGVERWGFVKEDIIWQRGIAIILGLICIGMHLMSHSEIVRSSYKKKNEEEEEVEITVREFEYKGRENKIDVNCVSDFMLQVRQFEKKHGELKEINEERYNWILSKSEVVFSKKDVIEECFNEIKSAVEAFEVRLVFFDKILKTGDYEEISTFIKEVKILMEDILREEQGLNTALNDIVDLIVSELQRRAVKNDNNNNNSDFNPFAGCNDKESLAKRYRSLVKQFHPDNQNGDTEQIQWLNSKYKELLAKMK